MQKVLSEFSINQSGFKIVQEKSLEAVMDRLPTAKVIKQDEKGYLVQAEAYGEGINMWLRSQGEWVEVV